eukprot:TRINITY_DN4703_c0_g2_i1.p1 TRINITY_DN4703_c0_g2~~TRINITY_DN4703_c0_g2_i1.p1  ORF type:complete len:1014 (-),score=219.66 TRINITY_DN4703_c0_g2_i1:1092-3920(-)
MEHSDPLVRDQSYEAFGSLVGVFGERTMQGYLNKLDKHKKKKILASVPKIERKEEEDDTDTVPDLDLLALTQKLKSRSKEDDTKRPKSQEGNSSRSSRSKNKSARNGSSSSRNGSARSGSARSRSSRRGGSRKSSGGRKSRKPRTARDTNEKTGETARSSKPSNNIEKQINEKIITNLNSFEFDEHLLGLDQVQSIIDNAVKPIQPRFKNLAVLLSSGVNDRNTKVAITSLDVLGNLIEAVGPEMGRYMPTILPDLLKGYSTKKSPVKNALSECLNKWVDIAGGEAFLVYLPAALLYKPGRVGLLHWMNDNFPKNVRKEIDYKVLISPIFECMQDRNKEVRDGAKPIIKLIIRKVGYKRVYNETRSLSSGVASQIKKTLEQFEPQRKRPERLERSQTSRGNRKPDRQSRSSKNDRPGRSRTSNNIKLPNTREEADTHFNKRSGSRKSSGRKNNARRSRDRRKSSGRKSDVRSSKDGRRSRTNKSRHSRGGKKSDSPTKKDSRLSLYGRKEFNFSLEEESIIISPVPHKDISHTKSKIEKCQPPQYTVDGWINLLQKNNQEENINLLSDIRKEFREEHTYLKHRTLPFILYLSEQMQMLGDIPISLAKAIINTLILFTSKDSILDTFSIENFETLYNRVISVHSDPNIVKIENGQLADAVNLVTSQLLDNSNQTTCFIVMIRLMQSSGISPHYTDILQKCIVKKTKEMSKIVDSLDVALVLSEIHFAFSAFPDWKESNDYSHSVLKTLLNEIVKNKGRRIRFDIKYIPVSQPLPLILQYVEEMVKQHFPSFQFSFNGNTNLTSQSKKMKQLLEESQYRLKDTITEADINAIKVKIMSSESKSGIADLYWINGDEKERILTYFSSPFQQFITRNLDIFGGLQTNYVHGSYPSEDIENEVKEKLSDMYAHFQKVTGKALSNTSDTLLDEDTPKNIKSFRERLNVL